MILKKELFTMRLQLLHLAAILAFFSFTGSQARAVDIYVLSGAGVDLSNYTTKFGKIDSVTGNYTQIKAEVSGANTVGNLAWNAANSAFYVTENLDAATNLRTLDVSGTLSGSLGTIGRTIYGMAYRPTDSKLYAYDFTNNDTGTIDPANGAWSLLNSSPVSNMILLPTGGRYTMHSDTIYASMAFQADLLPRGQFGTFGYTASSAFTQIGPDSPPYMQMVLASDGTNLYGIFGNGNPGTQTLYSINPIAGTMSVIAPITGSGLGIYFYGAGVGVTPVPEPSTYALAAIATGVMAYVARRRKGRQA